MTPPPPRRSSRPRRRFPTALEAEFIIGLWCTRRFDTADIAGFVRLHESIVVRTLQAARDIARQQLAADRRSTAGRETERA